VKKSIIKILKLLSPYKWWMIFAAMLGFFTIGSSIGLLMTSAYIIAKAALSPHIGELQVGIVGVRFFGISRGIFRYAERLFSHDVTFTLLAKFRVWFFKSIEPLVPSKTSKYTSGDLLTRVVSDVESLEHIFIKVISPPIIAVFVAFLMIFIFSFYSFSLVLAFLIPYFFACVAIPLLTYLISKKNSEEIIFLRTRLVEITIDNIDGRNELISFGKTEEHSQEFISTNDKLIKTQRKMKLISGMNESLIGLTMNFAVVVVFLIAAPLVASNIINGISLSVLTLGTMAAYEAVLPLPMALQYLKGSVKAGERIFQITEQHIAEKEVKEISDYKCEIEFKNVNFGYVGDEEILKDLSFSIASKEKIAIIGGSGAGKSSIINLALNFWNTTSGNIFVNGNNYNGLSSDTIRNQFSTIPQKVFLFSNTIKENLLIAKQNATDDELWNALREAELDKFVESLPNRLDTWIGNQGKQLSGGEKKRIAVARAILKNSNIFICDEISADLDSINEKKIIETIHRITKDKTLLFITHRLIDMEKYDTIYLLEDGEVRERGSHFKLLKASEEYKNYFN
jgi:ATP-binding cassette subfamily C protein CydC